MTGFLLVIFYFALAALAALIVVQPKRFVVTRSAVVDAPPQESFPTSTNCAIGRPGRPGRSSIPPRQTLRAEGPAAGAGAV